MIQNVKEHGRILQLDDSVADKNRQSANGSLLSFRINVTKMVPTLR